MRYYWLQRIMDSAEQAALSPQPDIGQPFSYYNAKRLNLFASDGKPVDGTREMILTPNPHFDHLPVNVSFSSVLLPANVKEDGNVLNHIHKIAINVHYRRSCCVKCHSMV